MKVENTSKSVQTKLDAQYTSWVRVDPGIQEQTTLKSSLRDHMDSIVFDILHMHVN